MKMKFKKVRINENCKLPRFEGMTGTVKKEDHKLDIDHILYLVIFPTQERQYFYIDELDMI